MEKITDDDLKAMLMNIEKPILSEEPQETQIPIDKEEINTKEIEEPKQLDSFDIDKQELDFNIIPDNIESSYEEKPLDPILKERDELSIGITPEDIKDFYNYVAGKAEKPLFIDKFMADVEGRLKEMTSLMTMSELSRLPIIAAYTNQLMDRMFSPENLYDMDLKTITSSLVNLNKYITNTLENSMKMIQTTSQYSCLNNEYRKALDGMLLLPPDKLKWVMENVLENGINLKKDNTES